MKIQIKADTRVIYKIETTLSDIRKEGNKLILIPPQVEGFEKSEDSVYEFEDEQGNSVPFTFKVVPKHYTEMDSFLVDLFDVIVFHTVDTITHEQNEIINKLKAKKIFGITSHTEDFVFISKPVYFQEFIHYPTKTQIIRKEEDIFLIGEKEFTLDELMNRF